MLISKKSRESGEAIQGAVFKPLVILLILGVLLQGALWFNAQNLANASAVAAYNNARADNGTPDSGQAAANQIIGRNGTTLNGATVRVTKTPTEVTVTVTGNAFNPIPFWSGPPVSKTISGPNERWVTR